MIFINFPVMWTMWFLLTATVDVKRNIFDLCTDPTDCYLAVIEVSQPPYIVLYCIQYSSSDCIYQHPVVNRIDMGWHDDNPYFKWHWG